MEDDWTVASARVRTVPTEEGEPSEHVVVELYGERHDDLCAGLTPGGPEPKEGEQLVQVTALPLSKGSYSFVTAEEEDDPTDGKPELSFSTRDSDDSWGGVPYGRGSVEITDVTDETVRGEIVGASGTANTGNQISGWFEAERCGCVNCPSM